MFGYIKPLIPELKVKDKELYQAYYCGLCRALGGYGLAGRAALTYDATFAALLLTAICGDDMQPGIKKHSCLLHPVRGKTPTAENTEVLDFCAALCVLLAKYKLKDDSRDGRPLRRCLLPAFARGCRKAADKYPALEGVLIAGLKRLSEIERANTADPDAAPLLFGEVLSQLICACPALPQDKKAVTRELCRAIGGFVYTIDAWDDRADDKKRGCYNIFNTAEANGLEPWPDGNYEGKTAGAAIPPASGAELYDMACAMLDMYINSACLAYDLLELGCNSALLDNIVHMGLGAAADSVLNKTEKEKSKDKNE